MARHGNEKNEIDFSVLAQVRSDLFFIYISFTSLIRFFCVRFTFLDSFARWSNSSVFTLNLTRCWKFAHFIMMPSWCFRCISFHFGILFSTQILLLISVQRNASGRSQLCSRYTGRLFAPVEQIATTTKSECYRLCTNILQRNHLPK